MHPRLQPYAPQAATLCIQVRGLIAIDRDPFDMRAPLFVAPPAAATAAATATTATTAAASTTASTTATTTTNSTPSPSSVASRERELAERLATLDRHNEARGEPLTEAALIDALAGGGGGGGGGGRGRVLMEGEALRRFARRYVASHRLTAAYVPSVPVDDLLQRAGP